jgi:hypothetical protein
MKTVKTPLPTKLLESPYALPVIDTGIFDFSPEPPVHEKAAKLRELPKEDLPDLLDWTLKKRPYLVPNRKFDIEYHKYLVDLYRCKAKEFVVMKSGQAGVSEFLVSYALHACDQRNANVLYVFPTEKVVSDFSTARLGPAIEASEYLRQIVIDGSSQGGMRGSDRITLKRIRDRFLYFRGSQVQPDGSAPQLKSVDADVLILDEVDELDQRSPAIAKKRLGHAAIHLGNTLWVSTPTYPGYGIHAEYLESDQRQWHIRCDSCGERQPLTIDNIVLEWDDLGRPVAWNGQNQKTAWAACRNCGSQLDRLGDGEWVAEYPDIERPGFHLTKLFSPHNQLIDVVKALDTVDETKRREAFNQDLGIPYTPRGGSLTTEDLDACRREYGHGPDRYKTCYMGIDVGNVLHVVVRTMKDFQTGETKQLYAGEANWESIHNLIKIYRPSRIVVDALPETTQSRKLQSMYPWGMVWIAYYPNQPLGSKKEEMLDWNVVQKHVLIDRTRMLDATLAGFYGRTSTLPAHARNIRDYYKQMRASIRTTKQTGSSEVEVATYIHNGADHYCLVAGTVVETEYDSLPIEKIKPGVKVLTRQGYKQVIDAGITSSSALVRDYIFSDGTVLTATPNHPIYVQGKGFIPLDSVIYGDIIETCQMSKLSPIEESSFAVTQIASGEVTEFILHQAELIEPKELSVFIKLFGKIFLGLFRKDTVSITRTKILLTIAWKIWNVFQDRLISLIMLRRDCKQQILKKLRQLWIKFVHYLKRGIRQKQESSYTKNLLRILDRRIERFLSVFNAGSLLKLFGRREILLNVAAQTNVMRLIAEQAEWITRQDNVNIAVSNTKSIDISHKKLAQDSVPKDFVYFVKSESAGNFPVYNLSVEDAEEYYANGILVHNCHAELYCHAASLCRIGTGWVQAPGA